MVSSRRATAPHLVPVDDGERWYGESGELGAQAGYRIATVRPQSFTDARVIGEYFRDGIPVIMNLADLEEADAKRIVDFASGLIFSLRGGIERVASRVFLLSPQGTELMDGAHSPSVDPGFFNQD
ncbi:MAG: cell division protein SepF [Actinocrinis sp.]